MLIKCFFPAKKWVFFDNFMLFLAFFSRKMAVRPLRLRFVIATNGLCGIQCMSSHSAIGTMTLKLPLYLMGSLLNRCDCDCDVTIITIVGVSCERGF